MASLNTIINVNILVSATSPSSANFGIPMVAAYHTHYASLIRYYSSLAGMVSDGFAVTEPAYLAAAEILDQNPTVTQFAIGRRALPYTQILHLVCSSTSTLDAYTFAIVGSLGVTTLVSVPSTGVAATDATSIAAAINAITPAHVGTASTTSATVIITQAVGKLSSIANWMTVGALGAPILALSDVTADPGIETDLAAIYAVDQGWYGLALDSNSLAEIESACAWTEANGPHVFCWNNSDAADIASGASVFTALKTLDYERDMGQFNGSSLLSYGGAAILGVILPQTPGSYTAAFKQEIGVPADPASVLTSNAVTNLTAANGNYYTIFKNVPSLISGITPSGTFLDTTIFIDWLKDAVQTAFYAQLVANAKIAYTDLGVGILVNALKGVLGQGVQNGGLAGTPAPTVSAPLVATIPLANVAARNVPNISFTATLAGAIQSVTINGTVVLP